MISVTGRKVAIVPIYDPEESAGWHGLTHAELLDVQRRGIKNDNNSAKIIIPDIAKERTDQGIVKYVGPKVKDLQPGDYVFYPNYAGTLMQIEDEGTLIILPEQFCTCKYHLDEEVIIPGLFFRSKQRVHDGHDWHTLDEYIPATYEMVANLLSQAFTDFQKTITLRTIGGLTHEEMDQLTAGAGVDDD